MAGFIDRNKLLEDILFFTGSSRIDRSINDSDSYVGSFLETGLAVGSVTNFVVQVGTRDVALEDISTVLDFSLVTDGRMTVVLRMYVEGSNINTWSHDGGGVALNVGRNLNATNINKLPESMITVNPANVMVSGIEDYELQFSEFFIDTQGNRENLATNTASFFRNGRRILLPANSEHLFVSTVTGDATGTSTNRSIFFTSEVREDN